MAVIQLLSAHLADMIAAGEVVERPANVVKELVENAFDADAQRVVVEIEKGGIALMRVSDDGFGMDEADLRVAFERHATSKIHQAEDLEAIVTMGFRGEALAAVAAVSRVTMVSRRAESQSGHSIAVEASRVIDERSAGCPQGTTVTVRDLFFNTPARFKFLKKDATEAGYIQTVVMRAALARPDVSVRFVKDGQEVFQTPGDNSLHSAIYSLYGRELAMELAAADNTYEGIRVSGFVGKPVVARGNRAMQVFIVNHRPVGSKLMMAALEEAYAKTLPIGRFPVCMLHLDLDPTQFDINVHPAKAEIKFMRERQIFEAIYIAVRNALQGADAVVRPTIATPMEQPSGMTLRQPELPFGGLQQPSGSVREVSPPPMARREAAPVVTAPSLPIVEEAKADVAQTQTAMPMGVAYKIVGEALGGYVVIEQDEQLLLLDKHAAHERILYEKWAASAPKMMAQQLLSPLVARFEPQSHDLLLQNGGLLAESGFEVEDYGDSSLLVRAIPCDIDASQATALLDELVAWLQGGRRGQLSKTRDEALKQMACKAAIKIGKGSQWAELDVLVKQVMTTPSLRHCPHGRPLLVALSRKEIEKLFLRA